MKNKFAHEDQAYCPLLRGRRWDEPTLVRISEKHGKGVGQVLVRWSLQKGYVTSSLL
jgi:diketogulonate reductase-like aldo/keto reductase